jgi:DNA-binding XRE family transcriptional regulator
MLYLSAQKAEQFHQSLDYRMPDEMKIMSESKWVTFEEMKTAAMKDKGFVREYETLREEYELAREVIYLRKQRNMTQQELAEKAGTSQPAIARLESGNYRNVSMSFMRKIGKVLGAYPTIHLKELG